VHAEALQFLGQRRADSRQPGQMPLQRLHRRRDPGLQNQNRLGFHVRAFRQ
jgi:hypothetical protein